MTRREVKNVSRRRVVGLEAVEARQRVVLLLLCSCLASAVPQPASYTACSSSPPLTASPAVLRWLCTPLTLCSAGRCEQAGVTCRRLSVSACRYVVAAASVQCTGELERITPSSPVCVSLRVPLRTRRSYECEARRRRGHASHTPQCRSSPASAKLVVAVRCQPLAPASASASASASACPRCHSSQCSALSCAAIAYLSLRVANGSTCSG